MNIFEKSKAFLLINSKKAFVMSKIIRIFVL